MFKYLYNAHTPLFIIILIDLIILVLLALFSFYFNYLGSVQFPYTISLVLFNLIGVQMYFWLAVTGYLLTGSRYTVMVRHIGKQATFRCQSGLLITTLVIGYLQLHLILNWPYTAAAFTTFGLITPWVLAISILLGYQLLRLSNLKYASLSVKALTVVSLLITSVIFIRALNYSLYTYFGINQDLFYSANDINPIGLTSLSSYNQVALTLLIVSLIILTVSLVQYIGIKKVGK